MSEFISKRIDERESLITALSIEIGQLQARRNCVEAELNAYKDILMNDPALKTQTFATIAAAQNSRLSDTWKKILHGIAHEFPEPSSNDKIREIIRNINPEISDDTIRSQLSSYTNRGWLARIGPGLYQITKDGAEACGYVFNEMQEMFI